MKKSEWKQLLAKDPEMNFKTTSQPSFFLPFVCDVWGFLIVIGGG
jgi:hypothetical protein